MPFYCFPTMTSTSSLTSNYMFYNNFNTSTSIITSTSINPSFIMYYVIQDNGITTIYNTYPYQTHPFEYVGDPCPPLTLKLPNPAVIRAENRRAKRALAKSADLFSRVLGEDNLRGFLGGKEITLEGTLYDYKIEKRKYNNLISHTKNPNVSHIPYSLKLAKKSGEVLGSGCIIYDQTPILDQIIALSLDVKDKEEERNVLKTCNWSFGNQFRSGLYSDI